MEAKILQVSTQGVQPLIHVGFFDGDTQKGENKYLLDPGQTIDDIKPKIKEYLNLLEAAVLKAKDLEIEVDKKVDLKGVKSVSELHEEQLAADKLADEENAKKPVDPLTFPE